MADKNTTSKVATNKRKKVIQPVSDVRITVNSSFNNTMVSGSDYHNGNVLAWASCGSVGFKGTKKGTPYAATTAMKEMLNKLMEYKPENAFVFVSGAGNGRDAALRALSGTGIKIVKIKDVTPLPHNGSRPKKARRV
ncbi:MAG: 30S ribosomal protein S11 [Patescibacteria group bacterium]